MLASFLFCGSVLNSYKPDEVEKQNQAVGDSLAGSDDEDVQVHSDGHGPEKAAGVGESGQRALNDAVERVGAEKPPDSESVGDRGQPVRHRQVNQQLPRGCPQIRPNQVCDDNQGGP